jgi:hypothetical protein
MANNGTSHYFHAEAHALAGNLSLPFEQNIKKQAFVKLEGHLAELSDAERAQRNYFSQHGKNFRLEGIISYASAHTQVSGHRSNKHDDASVTLATAVVEDLNVLNVVTADRVVAQISTTHFPDEYSPEVTFLGTHFENLRIARHKAEPYLNLGLVGERPKGNGDDALYVNNDTNLIAAAKKQYERLTKKLEGLGEREKKRFGLMPSDSATESETKKKYHGFAGNIFDSIAADALKARKENDAKRVGKSDGITCSLVENVEIKDIGVKGADGKSIEIPPPAKSYGHVIHIPDFGTIFLAELTVNHNSLNLAMIRLEMGCLADGNVVMASCNVNGGGSKGGGR